MTDSLLLISFDAADAVLEEVVFSRLFLTGSTGNSSVEASGTATVTAYFDSASERDAAYEALGDIAGIELGCGERERADWLDLYQQSLEPLLIGERFVVAPDPALIQPGSGRLELVVPQEQGFGTGSHETTALCIELLETLELRGGRGLDVGAGSGILALAMVRLGAARAIALDNDTDAYGALRNNRTRNSVAAGAMPIFIGSVEALRGGSFDAITMNIVPEVILPLLGLVAARLGSQGSLVLSGILLERRDEVLAACAATGLGLAAERSRGEWWAGTVKRVKNLE